jgi:hypothetical protein
VADVEPTQQLFDPHTLTLGFARRFATYKRPGLLLHDPERLLRLLTNPERPVQLIVAGKAHPQDLAGQAMVQAWVRFSQRPEARQHVVFLSDYDMLLAAHLVQGVDVWINNPRRPWEASGTSGMKVLVNGGLNLSELDGWWAEAYTPEVGWALGDEQEHDDDPAWDAVEAEALYILLEQEVIPAFYTRDASGIPTAWVARMRASMAQLVARFSANRTVREYTEQYYVPAAAAYRQRAANRGMVGEHIVDWQRAVAQHWAAVRFGALQVETAADQHVFQVSVSFGELDPDSVRVELYADPVNGGAPLADATNGYTFSARVPAACPTTDYTPYTPRLIPSHPEPSRGSGPAGGSADPLAAVTSCVNPAGLARGQDGNTIRAQHLARKLAPDTSLVAAQRLGVEPPRAVVVKAAIAGSQAGCPGNFSVRSVWCATATPRSCSSMAHIRSCMIWAHWCTDQRETLSSEERIRCYTMNASGRRPMITWLTSGTSLKKAFTPNSCPRWKRCWRLATAISACAGARRKAGPTLKTAPSSTGSMKPGRSSTARQPTASRRPARPS